MVWTSRESFELGWITEVTVGVNERVFSVRQVSQFEINDSTKDNQTSAGIFLTSADVDALVVRSRRPACIGGDAGN